MIYNMKFYVLICFLLFFYSLFFILSLELRAESLSIFIDLKPLSLSINAGGPGLGFGLEFYLKNYFSIYGKIVYMNFYDADIWLLYYMQGARFYFEKGRFDRFFIGIYGIALYGVIENYGSFQYGFQIDFGYKWRINGFEKYFIEPQIGYIYIFGEIPIPGLSLGLTFGIVL